MEEILETMDNIRNQTRKKLDSIYQLILITKRRRRLRNVKKMKKNELASQLTQNKIDHSSTINKSHDFDVKNEKQSGGRRLSRRRGSRISSFDFDRLLQLQNPVFLNYGRIPNDEGTFNTLVVPESVRPSA
jgi:hypothetical protein